MNNEMIMTTGNEVVDFIGKLNFTGNIIPEAWYRTVVNEKGKTNNLALMILSDIVYWYRPTEQRDERTNCIVYKKKFRSDILQRSYNQICDKFNCSQRQARDAIIFLEDLGVVKRVFRTIDVLEGRLRLANVMFIDLNPEVLYRLTFPTSFNNDPKDSEPVEDADSEEGTLPTNLQTAPSEEGTLFTNLQRGSEKNVKTNTKTTTEITKDILTTTNTLNNLIDPQPKEDDVVVKAKELFKDFNLAEKDILAILKAAGYSLDKCRQIIAVFDKQTSPIRNVVGWFISAAKNDYSMITAKKPEKKNIDFCNFSQRDYDFESLEKALLNNSMYHATA